MSNFRLKFIECTFSCMEMNYFEGLWNFGAQALGHRINQKLSSIDINNSPINNQTNLAYFTYGGAQIISEMLQDSRFMTYTEGKSCGCCYTLKRAYKFNLPISLLLSCTCHFYFRKIHWMHMYKEGGRRKILLCFMFSNLKETGY